MDAGEFVVTLAVSGILGLLPAWIAGRKGHDFWRFWAFGALLFIVALPWALLMRNRRRSCPHCGAAIDVDDLVCHHCLTRLDGRPEGAFARLGTESVMKDRG